MGARHVNALTIVDTDILIDAGQDVREAIECLADTDYLLSNPANAAHLRESLEQARTGHVTERED
jgi:hypothetical protein